MPRETTTTNTKSALITGGSRGLGRALAIDLAREGWLVVIDGRDRRALGATERAIAPADVIAIRGDVTEPAHRSELQAAVADAGSLDLLVNNASTLGPSPMLGLAEFGLDAFRGVLEANTLAPLAMMQSLSPWLDARGGRIVNVTSDAGVEAFPGWGGYGASKAALELVTGVWAAEHPAQRVYAFDPGDMATDMHQAAFPGEDISDRPDPETVLPALRALIDGDLESGRYSAADVRDEAWT